jgi:TPR repeat protein
MYRDGRGVRRDDAAAVLAFVEACRAHNGQACAYVGRAYETGKGLPRDGLSPQKWYARACADGDASACAKPR